MWPDRVSNPGPLTYESGALPTALRGPAQYSRARTYCVCSMCDVVVWIFFSHLSYPFSFFLSLDVGWLVVLG